MKKEFQNIFKKIKHEDKDFSLHKRHWEDFEQNNESIALNILCLSKDSEEITFLYKSEHNYNRENKVLLLLISDDNNEKILLFCGKKQIRIIFI